MISAEGVHELTPDEALDQLAGDLEAVETHPLTAFVFRAVLKYIWDTDPLPLERLPIVEGRWNDYTQDTVYSSHFPEVAFVERADRLARHPTLNSALAIWGDPDQTRICVFAFAPMTVRADFVWDGRLEPVRLWKGLLDPGPPYPRSQAFAIVRRDETGCHRLIAPSRPILQRHRMLAWNSAFYVCSLAGQPCGSQIPDRKNLQLVIIRPGTDFPSLRDLTAS